MRKIIAALAVGALAISASGSVAAKAKKTGEEQLAEMLKGRVAGTPVSCIPTYRNVNSTIIDKTAIVWRDGRTIYVNRTRNPQNLDWNDILVIQKFSASQLCKLDTVNTIDRGGGFLTGVVFLTDFVPYTLPEKGAAADKS
jgi:hypothetical protein